MQLRRRLRGARSVQDSILEADDIVPIVSLNEGAQAIMTYTSGNPSVVRRLSEMGLTPGCSLKLLRKGSFHGPIEVEVRGVALALGYSLASEIFVQVLKARSDV